jgi:allophanate hydrolase subunit 2
VSPFLSAEDLLEAAREAGGESLEPGAGSPRLAPPGEELLLRLLPGPQEEHFSPAGLETFFGAAYRVSASSDRRGVRLEGPPVELDRSPDIPPEGTAPGAIQIPGDGRPIVLGPDRPVTGGYAKPATVIAADLPLLAQARPGTRVRFRAVTLQDARQAMRSSMAWP